MTAVPPRLVVTGALVGGGREAGGKKGGGKWPDKYSLTRRLKRLLETLYKLKVRPAPAHCSLCCFLLGGGSSVCLRSVALLLFPPGQVSGSKIYVAHGNRRVHKLKRGKEWSKGEKGEVLRMLLAFGLPGVRHVGHWMTLLFAPHA